LKEIGAEAVIAEALDAAAVKAAIGRIRPDAVINQLTSLPRHYTPAEMKAAAERDRKVRVEGDINLLAACLQLRACRRCGRGHRCCSVQSQKYSFFTSNLPIDPIMYALMALIPLSGREKWPATSGRYSQSP
jgi:hypothetical protein